MKFAVKFLILLSVVGAVWGSYTVTDSGVVFVYKNPNARTVYLSGDFVKWDPKGVPMKRQPDGTFVAVVKLEPGTYQYKFVVDGVWMEDPDNPDKVDDGYGGFNSVAKVVAPTKLQTEGGKGGAVFTYFNPDAGEVYLTGDFANWDPRAIPMKRQPDGTWIARVNIPPGEHEYKFVVDGTWTPDPMNPVTRGEFGNSVILIKPDGTAVYPGGTQVLANSTSSSRILFSGRASAFLLTWRDRDLPGGYYGDNRWKLYRPLTKFDLGMRIHITQGVTGFGAVDVNTFDADKLYEAHLRLDSAGVKIAPEQFTIEAFFNRQIFQVDDILGLLGHYSYAQPTFEAPQKFGLGCGGFTFAADWNGLRAQFVVANLYEDWSLSPDSLDLPNLFGRRPMGFWARRVATSAPPADFSNFGTDIYAGRLERRFGIFAPAVNFRIDRNQWWLPTSEISYERFDSIYDANQLHSDWVDLGALEMGIAGELRIYPIEAVELGGEYMLWRYRASIDAGNRENHDHTADSTLDITLGTQKGFLATAEAKWNFWKKFSLSARFELEHYDSMSSDQTFIIPRHNDGSTGRPTLEFITPGNFDRRMVSAGLSWTSDTNRVHLGGKYEENSGEYHYYGGEASFEISLPGGRLIVKGIAMGLTGKYCGENVKFSDLDGLFRVRFRFWRDFWLVPDLWVKSLSTTPESAEYPDSVWKVNQTFAAPYLGISYQPKPSVEFEVSFGVRPYDVNGFYTGRQQWVYDIMHDAGISYLDALKRLSMFQGINIFAVLKF